MAKRGRPAQRPGWAARVFQHIPSSPAAPVSGVELQRLTGLGYMQVMAAVAYLRDNFPDFPLVSSHQGYLFSTDGRDVREFARWRVCTALTIMRHCYRGAIAPYLQHLTGNAADTRVVKRQFERALEDLGELVSATP